MSCMSSSPTKHPKLYVTILQNCKESSNASHSLGLFISLKPHYMASCATPVIHVWSFRRIKCLDIHMYYMCSRYIWNIHALHVQNTHIYYTCISTLREESSQVNVILQYKLLASILNAVCSVIQQSQYVLHFYYALFDGKYDCKITMHKTIFQLQCFVLLNNHQYNCNITTSFLSVHMQYMCRLYTCVTHVVLHI